VDPVGDAKIVVGAGCVGCDRHRGERQWVGAVRCVWGLVACSLITSVAAEVKSETYRGLGPKAVGIPQPVVESAEGAVARPFAHLAMDSGGG
jgi:hypothetical protein